jgi:hypothetical protein
MKIEFWEPMAPPRAGQEREFARDLEDRYRKALGLTTEKNSALGAGKGNGTERTPSS